MERGIGGVRLWGAGLEVHKQRFLNSDASFLAQGFRLQRCGWKRMGEMAHETNEWDEGVENA